ncbi:MAG: aminotransferase class I/II-fold pyridoxal phosphate-dependent enzyme, partial [Synergistaceae bacterium]|nr:aminotransferase class I/II-fold pyridoxal phosphate-dependent enzyme [Synergistaceae bacterium]
MSGGNLSAKLIHSGDGRSSGRFRDAVSLPETFPVYMTSAFAFESLEALDAAYDHAEGYIYSRMANPNSDAVSSILAAADEGEGALVFSSGMAAITMTILSLVKTGDHILASPVLYGGVRDFLANELARFGVSVTFADLTGGDIKSLIRRETKLIYTETICNPLMEVPDIAGIAEAARESGVFFLIDNTFATPSVAEPITLGADAVLYSATKYLGGHADITAGAVVGNAEVINAVKRRQTLYGATLGPSDCWLLARSLRTLDLRMKKHSENAMAAAKFLESHPAVERVHYPGLESSPSRERARRFFRNGLCGGMLSADLKGGEKSAASLIEALEMIAFVPSLAGTATTVSYAAKTSHRAYSREERGR